MSIHERASTTPFSILGMWKTCREMLALRRISTVKKMIAFYSSPLPHIEWNSSTMSIESM